MNKIILLAGAIILSACNTTGSDCKPGGVPSAPHGTPDDQSTYSGTDGYKSITFTYYCYNGKYLSYTYTRSDGCSKYELSSSYESSGICKIQ